MAVYRFSKVLLRCPPLDLSVIFVVASTRYGLVPCLLFYSIVSMSTFSLLVSLVTIARMFASLVSFMFYASTFKI